MLPDWFAAWLVLSCSLLSLFLLWPLVRVTAPPLPCYTPIPPLSLSPLSLCYGPFSMFVVNRHFFAQHTACHSPLPWAVCSCAWWWLGRIHVSMQYTAYRTHTQSTAEGTVRWSKRLRKLHSRSKRVCVCACVLGVVIVQSSLALSLCVYVHVCMCVRSCNRTILPRSFCSFDCIYRPAHQATPHSTTTQVYMYMCRYTCMWIACVSMCAYKGFRRCVWGCMYVHVCVCVYVCACVVCMCNVYVDEDVMCVWCICVWVCAYICTWMCTQVCRWICTRYVHVSIYMYGYILHICVYVWYVYIYIRVCMDREIQKSHKTNWRFISWIHGPGSGLCGKAGRKASAAGLSSSLFFPSLCINFCELWRRWLIYLCRRMYMCACVRVCMYVSTSPPSICRHPALPTLCSSCWALVWLCTVTTWPKCRWRSPSDFFKFSREKILDISRSCCVSEIFFFFCLFFILSYHEQKRPFSFFIQVRKRD